MTRSAFSRAMEAYEAHDAAQQRQVVVKYMAGLLDGNNRVNFPTIAAFHEFTTVKHPFSKVDNQPEPTRASSRQRSTISGSRAALNNCVRPTARIAAITAFSVAPTETTGKLKSPPGSRPLGAVAFT